MEDDIPLWEITSAGRAEGLIAEGAEGVPVLASALLELARAGEIRVLVGPWNDPEPREVEVGEAEPLLADGRRYDSAEEMANDLERVYYFSADSRAK